jgi:hypothetical protein
MAEINVTFWGICTYIRDRRRFVLVNAGAEIIDNNPGLQGRGIDPHYARLHIHAEDIVSIGALPVNEAPGGMLRFDLDQVTLAIANPELPAEVLADANMCAPHLSHYANEEIGPPNAATVTGGPSMAAFFDVVQGELRSFRKGTPDGACVNVLTSQTVGDPVLTITPFGTTSTSAITLRSGASILITNLPDPGTGADRDVDFLLHFLTADVIPTAAEYPKGTDYSNCAVSTDLEDGGIDLYVGPGCSNTNYP